MLTAYCDGLVFGEKSGTGSPKVLALHGWRNTHSDIAAAIEGFDAIALDLPGFGASPEPTFAWGATDYAQAISQVLKEFDTPPVVFGHSHGGRVAVNLAAMFPDQIKALVLTGVPLIRHQSGAKAPLSWRLIKMANKIGIVSDAKIEAEKRKRGSEDYRAATGIMRDTFVKVVNESYEDQLRAITVPVEMVWGENDTAAPLGQAQEALELLANAKLTMVPGGTHFITKTDPQPLREAIERALA